MRTAEHGLMIAMFVKQRLFIKMVVEVLESRGLVSGDELRAFELRANADEPAKAELFEYMAEIYAETATRFGVETGIKLDS
jgi:hypothetical protein